MKIDISNFQAVEKGLPEPLKEVLVIGEYAHSKKNIFSISFRYKGKYKHSDKNGFAFFGRVTHWAYLPEEI